MTTHLRTGLLLEWADDKRLAGVPADAGALRESVRLIAAGGMVSFRTTVVEAPLSAKDLKVLRLQIPPDAPYARQTFHPERARDARLREESSRLRRALEREAVAS